LPITVVLILPLLQRLQVVGVAISRVIVGEVVGVSVIRRLVDLLGQSRQLRLDERHVLLGQRRGVVPS